MPRKRTYPKCDEFGLVICPACGVHFEQEGTNQAYCPKPTCRKRTKRKVGVDKELCQRSENGKADNN